MTLYWRHQVCRSNIGMTHIMSKWFSFDVNLCSQNLVMTLYFFTGCAITQLQVPIAESNKAWNEKLSRARQSRKKSSTPHMAASGGQTSGKLRTSTPASSTISAASASNSRAASPTYPATLVTPATPSIPWVLLKSSHFDLGFLQLIWFWLLVDGFESKWIFTKQILLFISQVEPPLAASDAANIPDTSAGLVHVNSLDIANEVVSESVSVGNLLYSTPCRRRQHWRKFNHWIKFI